jgi:pimeloyl-ACP methyl ester carboxylesterase
VKVRLADGRTLRYWSSATPGPVVLFFHGCPDTRRMAMTGDQAAREVGVRLLAFNRPGYGSSTPAPSTHTSVARDALELLDLWGIERVGVLGMSVGATYAAAFAASYPERTTGLALVSAPSMEDTLGLTVEEAVERVRPGFEVFRTRINPADEDNEALAARFLAELPGQDAALLLSSARTVAPTLDLESAAEFVGDLAWEALVEREGYLRDAALLTTRWDFSVGDVRCPVWIWAGEDDQRAAVATRWWVEQLPQAEVEVLPATTHLAALLTGWPVILRRLSAATG